MALVFFEATLATYLAEQGLTHARVEGIEVHTAQTPYLPSEHLHRVQGSWDICDHAEKADVLIFVYPRTGQLVRRYMERFHRTASIVLWLGPRADWDEQQILLHSIASFGQPIILRNAGLVQYEVGVLWENTTEHISKAQAAVDAEIEVLCYEEIKAI